LDAVSKVYGKGQGAVAALREVSVEIPRGSFTAVMGPSGSGKSTFLHCAAGLDVPTSGSVRLGDTDLARMTETQLTELRRQQVGFVFQAFNLIPALTVLENITLPLRLAGARVDSAWPAEIVRRVGLDGRTGHRPAQLSGGQQQRVAIARALVTRPQVVFADEPTGALDTVTARGVLGLLREVVDGMGQTVVMVTHDPVAASAADHVLFLADGRIVDTMAAPSPEKVAERMTRLGAWT
jgi:putative ABC transport system ATP-binding protein